MVYLLGCNADTAVAATSKEFGFGYWGHRVERPSPLMKLPGNSVKGKKP
jgi:hypothetical protein